MEVTGKALRPSQPAGTSPDGQPGRAGQSQHAPESRTAHRKFLSDTTAFRFHANNSTHERDYDDDYRTLTLHADGTFTDYNEHLWDLKSGWITEGVSCIVYSGTYTLGPVPQIELRYTKIISKVNDVVTAKESLAADEPLDEPVIASGTLSVDGKSLTVKRFQGGEAKPQTLLVGGRHKISGASDKYS
jgi:hypothetical protein